MFVLNHVFEPVHTCLLAPTYRIPLTGIFSYFVKFHLHFRGRGKKKTSHLSGGQIRGSRGGGEAADVPRIWPERHEREREPRRRLDTPRSGAD